MVSIDVPIISQGSQANQSTGAGDRHTEIFHGIQPNRVESKESLKEKGEKGSEQCHRGTYYAESKIREVIPTSKNQGEQIQP